MMFCVAQLGNQEFSGVHLLSPPEDDSLLVSPQPEPLSVTGLLFMLPACVHSGIRHPGMVRAKKEVKLANIPTEINVANDLTKGLGWMLHVWHVRQAMGHHRPTYAATIDSVPCTE